MQLQDRIDLLVELGHYLNAGPDPEWLPLLDKAEGENPWFTRENILNALASIAGQMLSREHLERWVARYPAASRRGPDKDIAIIMAGNLPLVGFHDWLCVFVSGHAARVKLSDKDKVLLPFLVQKMGEWSHESRAYTYFVAQEEKLGSFDAVIATGSNNTARYFRQYFGKYPHIIRQNRNSVAILDGNETPEQIRALGQDIFSFFGLGCRNVSKVYVPQGYDFSPLLDTLSEYRELSLFHHYRNNYDYNLALLILNKEQYMCNDCLILRENPSLHSRIACVHYEYYAQKEALLARMKNEADVLQCVVSSEPLSGLPWVGFGETQKPGLTDYADQVDTMAFLTKLGATAEPSL